MTSLVPFQATDLLELNAINLDPLTENYNAGFYLEYLTQWPSLCFLSKEFDSFSGYMLGKTEGKGELWHTHITAVTVNPHYRRIGLASYLCSNLEYITDNKPHKTEFIDLFVKVTNLLAIQLYEKLGYSVYRRVIGYYGGENDEYPTYQTKNDDNKDAYDMRKAMERNKGKSVRKDGKEHRCLPHEITF